MSAQMVSQAQVEKIYYEMVEAAKAKDFDKIRAFFEQEQNKTFINAVTEYSGTSVLQH